MTRRLHERTQTSTSTAGTGGGRPLAFVAAFLLGAACGGFADDDDTTAGTGLDDPGDPCAAFTDCVECGDAGLDCAWCAGSCRSRPDGASISDDSWCEWGFAESGTACQDIDGIRLVESTLPIDCRSSMNEGDPRCQVPDDDNAAELGEGPAFPGGFGGLFGGYLDVAGNRVILGAMTNRPGDELGSIWTADLASGDRALVSGATEDAIVGWIERGAGPGFGTRVFDVDLAPDGAWIAYADAGLFRVDPDTGDRTRLWSPESKPCVHVGIVFAPNGVDGSSVVVGPDGTMYIASGEDENVDPPPDSGVFAIQPDGSCRMLTMSSSETERVVGNGPLVGGDYRGLVLQGDKLLALGMPGDLHEIDLATGDRRLVTSETRNVGEGPPADYQYLAVSSTGTLLASGDSVDSFADATRAMTEIDPASGDRKLRWAYRGPATSSPRMTWIAPHPELPGIYIAVEEGQSLVLYEPASGNTNLLSH
ncbi:hypothetical protein SAMN02745121_08028 [Nannocystis exedens]|uniref:Uncharacterized protein n=1 Tax=Nannocystis exedens TaxID=54 RepID=A0A1I2HNS9_9BACT|nr:hypothetical protein NAEX_05072 [Nannocystis exedens]SFF30386.1 hypothetical protein SAMN02745121_08028 [Nannocystis exedens]